MNPNFIDSEDEKLGLRAREESLLFAFGIMDVECNLPCFKKNSQSDNSICMENDSDCENRLIA